MKTLILCAVLATASCGALAQTVWRCSAEQNAYGQQACLDGKAVAVADARSAAQVQAARDVVQRDKALARDMAAQRKEMEREAAVKGSGLIAIKGAEKPAAKTAETHAKPRKNQAKKKHPQGKAGDTWTSTAPASPRKRG